MLLIIVIEATLLQDCFRASSHLPSNCCDQYTHFSMSTTPGLRSTAHKDPTLRFMTASIIFNTVHHFTTASRGSSCFRAFLYTERPTQGAHRLGKGEPQSLRYPYEEDLQSCQVNSSSRP